MFILVIDDHRGVHEHTHTDESEARDAWLRYQRQKSTWSATLWREGSMVKVLDFDKGWKE